MSHRQYNPKAVSPPVGNYTHGLEVEPNARYLFISGQTPEQQDGKVPSSFEAQCNTVWDNIFAILASANMKPENLVKVTTYLTHANQAEMNSRIRQHRLGDLKPALTAIIAQTLEASWLLEIEAIAASKE